MNVNLKPEAEKDILEPFVWHEQQKVGLGEDLLEAIDLSIKEILNNPKSFQIRYRKTRINFNF